MATDVQIIAATRRYAPDIKGEADSTGRRAAAVTAALLRFGRDIPRVRSISITANPTATASITGWVDTYSEPVEVEWPVNTSEGAIAKLLKTNADGSPRATVDREISGDAYTVRFPNLAPTAGEPMTLRYTIPWTSADLVATWVDAVGILAASLYSKAMAGVYSAGQSAAPGDVLILEAGDKVRQYEEQAAGLMLLYRDTIGKPAEGE